MRQLLVLITVLLSLSSYAQSSQPEMADKMRSEGKIFVLVAIILIILGGLFFYLFNLDRKISRLENNSEKRPE